MAQERTLRESRWQVAARSVVPPGAVSAFSPQRTQVEEPEKEPQRCYLPWWSGVLSSDSSSIDMRSHIQPASMRRTFHGNYPSLRMRAQVRRLVGSAQGKEIGLVGTGVFRRGLPLKGLNAESDSAY